MRTDSLTKGFTLVEAVVALGVFVIFVVGIYGSIQLSFSLVYQSRIRIAGTALLNERMEIIRNTSFENVGIKNGSPAGVFDHVTSTNRTGMIFEITHTVRNIDDPYDGTIGGVPSDTAPADYKFVQVDVRCTSCGQTETLSMYTYVAPKYLEGNSNNGALFVRVIDAYGNPVPEATVRLLTTSTNPIYNFSDVTDADGYLRIYDLATGTAKFYVEASKSGYTLDYTRTSTSANPNPVTPLVSVLKQAVSNLTLSIDRASYLNIQTQNAQCTAMPGVSVSVKGTRVIGTIPDVYMVSSTYITSATGTIALSLPWDSYGLAAHGYDLIGTIPDLPISLLPGSTQNAQLVLGNNTSRSLIVAAKYQGAPIANATVTITGPGGFTSTKTTGVGSIAQTDWSAGAGETYFGEGRGFSSADGIDTYTSPGNATLVRNGANYIGSGYLESSTIETGENARYIQWSWNPMIQPASTTLRFQIATASSSAGAWNFVGPDGTAATYYNQSNVTISSVHDNDRFMRYRVYMDTSNPTVSPLLSDLNFIYTNACIPPGQVYVGELNQGTYTITINAAGYQEFQDQVDITTDYFLIADLISL